MIKLTKLQWLGYGAVVLFLLLMPFIARAEVEGQKAVEFLSDSHIYKGGTSVFAVDLTERHWADAKGFSVGLSAATPFYVPTSGATVPPIGWAVTNHLPGGLGESDLFTLFDGGKITEGLEWTPLMSSGIDHVSGVSRILWPFVPDPGQYLFLRVDNRGGVTDFLMTAWLGQSKVLQVYRPIEVVPSVVLNMPANGTGVSTVTVPPGTRYTEFSLSGSSRYYTTDGLTTPSVSGTGVHCADLEGFSLEAEEARRIKIAPSSSACKVTVKFLTSKP